MIHKNEADKPKIIPTVSTRRVNDIPGERLRSDISGYLPESTSGSMEKTKLHIDTAAIIVQDSRIFGLREEITISAAANIGISTANKGLQESNISINYP
ncbi:hypothetical protein ACFLYB_02070 [Chloroflexota bacterium]